MPKTKNNTKVSAMEERQKKIKDLKSQIKKLCCKDLKKKEPNL